MDNWENKFIKERGLHYSRVIASWVKANCKENLFGKKFKQWLKEEAKLDDKTIEELVDFGRTGKLEWECNAIRFLEKEKDN